MCYFVLSQLKMEQQMKTERKSSPLMPNECTEWITVLHENYLYNDSDTVEKTKKQRSLFKFV